MRPSSKNQAVQRPDKAAFQVFMGAFFLIASVPSAFFSFRHFQDHQQHLERVQHFRQNPEAVPDGSTAAGMIALNQSLANKDLLTAIVLGIGSLLFFGIVTKLFVLAAKSNRKKAEFEIINWQIIPKPTRRVEVHYKRVYEVLFVVLAVFLSGLMLLVVVTNGIRLTGVIISVGNGFIIIVVYSLLFRARRTMVCLFDEAGVMRGDKRHFDWNNFRGVITRRDINLRSRRKYVWRVELAFVGGETAWIIPNRVENYDEVFEYLATLPRAIEMST